MKGLLILDKPRDITSAKAVAIVKRRLRAKKAGHGGTLDPMATGVLPILLGEGTKLARFLIELDKGYLFKIRIGISTDTGDADGKVIEEKDWSNVDKADLEAAVTAMRGTIEQVPPMFSALKKDGVRLYKLARQGKEVPRESRSITIHKLEVKEFDPPFATLTMECSKGTYVREVGAEIGRKIGCGAHIVELRRTRSGPFDEVDAIELDDLSPETAVILDLVQATEHLPTIRLDASLSRRVRNGHQPTHIELRDIVEHRIDEGSFCRLLDSKGELVAVAETVSDIEPGTLGNVAEPVRLLRVFNG